MQSKVRKRKTRGTEWIRGAGAQRIQARRAEERTERTMPSSDDSMSVSVMPASTSVKETGGP